MRVDTSASSHSGQNIVLVEDNDAKAMGRALTRTSQKNPIIRAVEGVDSLTPFQDENDCSPGRHLTIADINSAAVNGHGILSEIRDEPELDRTNVFTLTTSNAKFDRTRV